MYDRYTSDVDRDVDDNTRVGDSDREATAERLRHHHAEGRIDVDELQERLDRCYRAMTAGQLREVVADLPQEARRAARYFGRRRPIWLVPILLSILAVTALSGGHGPHGFLFVLLAFLVVRHFLWPRRRWSTWAPRGGAERQV